MQTIGTGPFANRRSGAEDFDLSLSATDIGSAAGTTYSQVVEFGGPKACSATLDSLGLTAADALTVTIQGSEDGTFTAPDLETLTTFTAISGDTAGGVTKQTLPFVSLRFVRARYVTTGASITANCTLKGKVRF